MFFVLSKTLGLFMAPSNLMAALGLIGIALLFTRFRRLASWLIVTSLVLIVFAGYSSLGNILMLPLEQRSIRKFPWRAASSRSMAPPSASPLPPSSRIAIRMRASSCPAGQVRLIPTRPAKHPLRSRSWWRLAWRTTALRSTSDRATRSRMRCSHTSWPIRRRGVATARGGVWTAIRPTSLTTSVRDPGAAGILRMSAFGR